MKKALSDALLEISHPNRIVPDPAATVIASPTPLPIDKTAVASSVSGQSTVASSQSGAATVIGGGSTPPPASEQKKSGGGGKFLLIAAIIGVLLFVCVGGGIVTLLGGAFLLSGNATATPARVQVVATATSSSSAAATATPAAPVRTPTPAPPTPIPLGNVLFQDNFASNTNSWDLSDDDDLVMYFEDGAYHIENTGNTDTTYFTSPKGKPNFGSFAMEAEISKVDGPDDKGYGIGFRAQGVDGYDFLISGDGRYQLSRYVEFLQQQNNAGFDRVIEWTKAPAGVINTGDARNKLKVVCRGSEITLYINDKYVATFNETNSNATKEGTIGLDAGTGVSIIAHSLKINAVS
jgi:hypothetical protein